MAELTAKQTVGLDVLKQILTAGTTAYAIEHGVQLQEGFTAPVQTASLNGKATPVGFGTDIATTGLVVAGVVIIILLLMKK